MTAKGWGLTACFASRARLLAAPYHLQRRKVAGEGAAFAQGAGDIQARAVTQQHMLDDGQAKPGATGISGAAGVDPVGALSQARQILGPDTQPSFHFALVRVS